MLQTEVVLGYANVDACIIMTNVALQLQQTGFLKDSQKLAKEVLEKWATLEKNVSSLTIYIMASNCLAGSFAIDGQVKEAAAIFAEVVRWTRAEYPKKSAAVV